METIKIIIEKTEDMFSAYAENVEGIYAGGDTVTEVKQSVIESIELLREFNSDENIPEILKGEFEINFSFDLQSLLSYYKGIMSFASLERLTGVNQKQLQHYSTGHRKPRKAQRIKIEAGIHEFGKELLSVELA